MIQRKQSLFLGLIALMAVIIFFLDTALLQIDKSAGKQIVIHFSSVTAQGTTYDTPAWLYTAVALNIVIFILSVWTILVYKNRPMQIKLCKMLLMLMVILLGVMFFTVDRAAAAVHATHTFYLYALYIPMVMMLLAYLAMRGIQADEHLVRSADRLRG